LPVNLILIIKKNMNKIFVLLFLFTFTIFPQTARNINYNMPDKVEFQKKSIGIAIVYSLLLPGMGELYAGNYNSGKYFTIAEAALWGTYIGMNTYSNWQKNRYHSFAASNGGVDIAGKSDDYFANIGAYLDINEYNDDMARNAEFNKMYNLKTDYWKWTPQDRVKYRAMWTSGEQSHNNLRFVVGGLVLNRVVSAINAARLVVAYNKNASREVGWNLSAGMSNDIPFAPSYTLNFRLSL
jgi:hypothetical protein